MTDDGERKPRPSARAGKSPVSSEALAEIFHDISDARIHTVILHRASGSTWKECAAAAGVTERLVYKWKTRYPLDERAAMLAAEAAKQGALTFVSSYGEAADYIMSVMRDPKAKVSDRLRAAMAAVTQVGKMSDTVQAAARRGIRPADAEDVIDAPQEAPADDVRPPERGLSKSIRARLKRGNGS